MQLRRREINYRPELYIYSQYFSDDLRVSCDVAQFVVRQRFLRMEVRVLDEFQHLSGLVVRLKMYSELIVNMSKPLDAAVFSRGDDPSCFEQFRLSPADVFGIVKFVIAPVFQCTVGMDAGFVRKRVGPDTRLIDRDRKPEGVRSVPRDFPGPLQVHMLVEVNLLAQPVRVFKGEDRRDKVAVSAAFAVAV